MMTTAAVIIPDEVEDSREGDTVGVCKWFSDRLGYGFVTVCSGEARGKDVFVHYKGIRPTNSTHRTLHKGEYVSFSSSTGAAGEQAVNVTGVFGGPLMCDVHANCASVPTAAAGPFDGRPTDYPLMRRRRAPAGV